MESIARALPDFTDADTLRVREDGAIIKLPQVSRIFRVRFSNSAYVDSALAVLPKIPAVLYAEKHMDAELGSDPTYTNQWHLNNTGQAGGTPAADIKAEQAWQIFTGSSSVKIGVFDGGVELSHDEFIGKVTGDPPDASGADPYWSHGTHVAGIAAAKANNNKGGRGVDWNAQVDSRRIFNGFGNYLGDQTVYNNIISATNNGVHVHNHSWGGTTYSTTVRLAFAYAYKMNRVSVAIMHNDGGNVIRYPAAFGQGIVAVGATQNNDVRAWYSNWGNHIDVVAPGGHGLISFPSNDARDIWSTWRGNSYQYLAGTSMAAPQVSGIASLLKGYNANLYNDDIEQIIQLAVDKPAGMGGQNWTDRYGYGRVNVKKALDFLRSPYTLNQWTASSGTVYSISSTFQMTFYSTPGLADGVYVVKRYVVRKNVTFPLIFSSAPYVWGRGVASTGYSYANPNFGMGFCQVVGSVTTTGATLETVVYEVWTIGGQYKGFIPTTAANAVFGYTALGVLQPLAVTITGPTELGYKQSGTWTANASGGTGSYTYEWRFRYNGTGAWSSVLGTSQTYTRTMLDTDFELQVKLTSGGQSVYDTHYVEYGIAKQGVADNESIQIPEQFALHQNYPNPFNPTTEIKYELPENGFITLNIFNVTGQRIRTLVDEPKNAGYHSVLWDGKDEFGNEVASGVYLYRISVTPSQPGSRPFESVKKMTLVR